MLLPVQEAREGALESRDVSKQSRTFIVVCLPLLAFAHLLRRQLYTGVTNRP
jgi:hypothetical protein